MGKCVVKECNSRSQNLNKADGITFHAVPKDPVRREKWMEVIRLLRKETDWLPTKSTTICSKHFRSEDKLPPKDENGRIYLSEGAVPVIFEESTLNNQTGVTAAENLDSDEYVETDDEMNEILQSPGEYRMGKIIKRLKFVSAQRLKRAKKLSQQNRRLKVKNKKLKDVIDKLKRKLWLSKEEELHLNVNCEVIIS